MGSWHIHLISSLFFKAQLEYLPATTPRSVTAVCGGRPNDARPSTGPAFLGLGTQSALPLAACSQSGEGRKYENLCAVWLASLTGQTPSVACRARILPCRGPLPRKRLSACSLELMIRCTPAGLPIFCQRRVEGAVNVSQPCRRPPPVFTSWQAPIDLS